MLMEKPELPLVVYFVRHGESHANADRIFANRRSLVADLTSKGRSQARELARKLRQERITHVYTSPLPRAQQTANIIARELGLSPMTTDALREYDVGELEGMPYSGDHGWRWRRYEHVERCWHQGLIDACHPGGESLADLASRFMPFMDTLTTRHEATDVLVLVGHGGLYRAVLPRLFSIISPEYAQAHALGHMEMVRAAHQESGWQCLQWGDEHVSSGGTGDRLLEAHE